MLYTSHKRDFKGRVHPALQRRIRIFLVMGGIMLGVLLYDVAVGQMSPLLALIGVAIGAFIGYGSSRIFHLSWDTDGSRVVGRIDTLGWFVLASYILFEIVRATLFETVIHTGYTSMAVTFAFVASALISRVFGLRGRIIRILKREEIFG